MITILCYGSSSIWGFVPGSFDLKTNLAKRFEKNERWSGILANLLGENFDVREEGFNGRTIACDDQKPNRNGLKELPRSLEQHYPMDLVIFMLGTNDAKIQFAKTAAEIAEGMRKLIQMVKQSNKGPDGKPPKIMVIAPQKIIKCPGLSEQFDEKSIKTANALPELFQQLAARESCEFLDASAVVTSSDVDGIHFGKDQHKILAEFIAGKIMQLFSQNNTIRCKL